MFIKATPQVMEDHVTAINVAMSQLQLNQDAMNKTLSNPGLMAAGQDWVQITAAVQRVDRDLTQLHLSHSQLGQAVLNVLNNHLETDASSARNVSV